MSDPITRLNAALEGRYRVERELGEGGMATVYLADDLRHERKVALKVLKPELAAVVGAERFLAEIKTTANLQHPHILPLFDSGDAEGFLFYVMPYVAEESLRQRLDRERQLPVDEAVAIASKVAVALDYAHRHGVIHRDIKPANVMLHDGEAVIADFGIALAVSAAGGGRLTETGLSLGTPHYMSPEQATGDQSVGPASDIYALGCVLYETLAGQPPHTGSTAQAVLGKIVTGEPDPVTAHRKSVPTNVEAVIERALEKVPADRFARAMDLAEALADPGFVHGGARAGVASVSHSPWKALSIAATCVALVVAAALVWALTGGTTEQPPVVYSSIMLPSGETLAFADYAPSAAGRPSVALAPDGSKLAYVAARDDVSRLFFLDLTDGSAARELRETEGAFHPFFSPDGAWVGFFTATALKRISLSGGSPLTVTAARYAVGADWPEDGTIVFSDADGKRVQWIAAETGEVQARLDVAEGLARWPEVLPDGETVLVTNASGGAFPSIMAVSLTSDERKVVVQRGSGARYVEETGHLLYAGEGGIMAIRFDPRSLEVIGSAVSVLEGVRVEAYGRAPQLTLSDNGLVAFAPGEDMGITTPVWVDRNGLAEPLPLPPARYGPLRLSSDGSHLAISVSAARADVRLYDFSPGSELQPLTTLAEDHRQPLWSPDGQRVAFYADLGTDAAVRRATVFIQDIGGGAPVRVEQGAPGSAWPQAWSSNGDLALSVEIEGAETDVWVLPPDASEARPFLQMPGDQWPGAFSPDGRWLAYHSDHSGIQEVYITDYPDGTTHELVSTHPGEGKEPIWSPLGDEVFYRSDSSLYAVSVQTDPTLTIGTPRHLFRGPFVTVGGPEFDVGPDAQRFVMLMEPGQPPATRIRLIANWFGELEEQMGN